LLFGLALALSGCMTGPAKLPSMRLSEASQWRFEGKLGVKAAVNSGNLSISWAQLGDAFDVHLYGPLGITVAEVSGDAGGATLSLPDRPPLLASSPEALVREALGYTLPVSPMRYWVRGIPAPGEAFDVTTDGFRQFGWQVVIRQRDTLGPIKIHMHRPEVSLLLVVKSWDY
jgi:outer membrane lipoprotein LolB